MDDLELADPNPNMTPEEVLAHYSPMYPELANSNIEKEDILTDPITFEQKYQYTVETKVGSKG